MTFSRRQRIAATAVLAVAALTAAGLVLLRGPAQAHLTVYFRQATGLYPGDRVLVLGVPVGTVDSISPQPGRVRVELSYDRKVKIPAAADAAIVAPTLVTSRSVQLAPVYRGGPVLPDDATIPEPRTAIPVEWDQIEQELNRLATSLGPKGQSSGALTRLLDTTSANLTGQGRNLHATLARLSAAIGTLSDSRGNLFATVDNLQTFVAVLADANAQVDAFDRELASVSGVLDGNRRELATTLATLNSSLAVVTKFVHLNRGALAADLARLTKVTANFSRSRQSLADILQVAPTELANFNNIYDPVDTSLTGTLALANFKSPAEFICATIFSAGGTPAQCQRALSPLAQVLHMDNVPVSFDPVNRNGRSNQVSSSGKGSGGTGGGPGSSGLLGLLLGGGGQ
ncbi:MAG TPA: MCE family protein [Streptosporangiaceae bacterium]|nr:MCE family protein [Streptosporangiaceae bacterium]